MKIKVIIDKIGTYTSPGAIDPEIGYDSDSCGIIGVKFSIWVDKHNYSKYSSIVYWI